MKRSLIVLFLLAGALQAQMEMRDLELYRLEEFRRTAPALGEKLGDFELRDLDGKAVKLSSLLKKPVVIIGGAYT